MENLKYGEFENKKSFFEKDDDNSELFQYCDPKNIKFQNAKDNEDLQVEISEFQLNFDLKEETTWLNTQPEFCIKPNSVGEISTIPDISFPPSELCSIFNDNSKIFYCLTKTKRKNAPVFILRCLKELGIEEELYSFKLFEFLQSMEIQTTPKKKKKK